MAATVVAPLIVLPFVFMAASRAQVLSTPNAKPRLAIDTAPDQKPENDDDKDQKSQEAMKAIQSALGALGGGGGGGGDDASAKRRKKASASGGGNGGGGSSADGGGGSGGSLPSDVDGSMKSCGTLPPSVAKNLQELQDFRKGCKVANTGSNQKFAINDYSCKNGTPMMYLFDTNGTCEKKMAVTFGNGKGSADNSCPKACATDKTHLTPPGFHLTAPHVGKKYGPNNSLLMVGLEGQGSAGRNILIHGAQSPGTASSWGCSGVGQENLRAVLNYLGNNALVYNAFDPSQLDCGGNSAGMKHDPASCRKDAGAPTVYPTNGGGGTNSRGTTAQ